MKQRRRAYSYLRFSTPEQERGDSFRRQKELAERYAELHDLDLDDRAFHDLGVSAFRGANAATGRLGEFLTAVREGVVERDSFLLVENLDRLSRNTARRAVRLLEDICDAGISVVTLADGRVYDTATLDGDPMAFMYAYMVAIRSNEESATKSRRLRSAWSNKRANIGSKRLTAKCPAWLAPNDKDGFDLIQGRAEIVRRMFQMTRDGAGQHTITNALNRESVPTFGRAVRWHRSYVAKVLSNPAVVGRIVPNELIDGRRRPLEAVDDYYPAVVDTAVFDEVQALLKSGKSRSGRNTAVRSVLAGLARCPQCGASVTRWSDGKRHYLVCTARRSGMACDRRNIRYEPIEEAIFAENGRSFEFVPPPGIESAAWGTAMGLEQKIDDKQSRARELVEAIKGSPATSSLLVSEVAVLEAEIASERAELDRMLKQGRGFTAEQWDFRVNRLAEACAGGDPEKVNQALRLLVEKVEVEDDEVVLHLLHGQTASIPVLAKLLD